ncbi:MAG: hypothetical protein IJO14_01420 [Clostridia bacterium]|nr:hypothetical protein [Clostridia bacterium]
MNEVIVRLMPLPVGVRAFTIPDADGDYNVYLNCRLSAEQQRRSLQHEQLHISRDDFYKDCRATVIERNMAESLQSV